MSKSKKRLIRNLTLVSAVVALGVVAISQAQRGTANPDSNDNSTSDGKPEKRVGVGNELPSPEASIHYRGQDPVTPEPPSKRGGDFEGGQTHETMPPPRPELFRDAVGSGGNFDQHGLPQAPSPPTSPPSRYPGQQVNNEGGSPAPPVNTSEFILEGKPTAPKQPGPPADDGAFVPDVAGAPLTSPAPPLPGPPLPSKSGTEFSPAPPAPISKTLAVDAASNDSFSAPPAPLPPAQLNSTGNESADGFETPMAPRQFSAAPVTSSNDSFSDSPQDYSAPTASSVPAVNTATSDIPGPAHLDGMRSPSLAIQKFAPPEIQVGKPATFTIRVQNVGQVEAENVVVYDRIPQGTRFLDATPQPERNPDGSLVWQLDTIRPGDEKTITLELQPEQEGEIGSVAQVAFHSSASVRTVCTKPQLELQLTAAPRVLIGENITIGIRISNPGTGAATGVVLEEDVPSGFSHPAGAELEFEVGTLRPGESRDAKLTLHAERAGDIENLVVIRGDGNLVAKEKVAIQVIAPELAVKVDGPRKRFLERRASYSVSLQNPGTAPARNVEMVAFLHKGMKFLEANNQGQYDPQNHAVYWSLEELPANQNGTVELAVLPIETGKQRLRVETRGDLGLTDATDHEVEVDGLASVFFEVSDVADPIEVGSDTVYRIRVSNQGSKAASNVQLMANLPPGMQPIGGDGPSGHTIQGQTIVFEKLARLAPKAEVMFQVQAKGLTPARHRLRVQLTSQDLTQPVTKEESTLVYSDQ